MIWNPGQLPPEWTVARLLDKHSSLPFNPDVANAFFRAGQIESWGRGIERMLEACQTAGTPAPVLRAEHSGLWVTFGLAAPRPTGSPTGSLGLPGAPLQRLVLTIGAAALAPSAIQQRLGLRHRPTFRENYLRPALLQGLVEMTQPDKPGSRLQQYRLTDAGKALWPPGGKPEANGTVMSGIGLPERATQNRVVALFRDELGYRNFGGGLK